uniref:Putative secreted protein n=1 Tax=Anopheles darlingi TaxID=43151 RepID=A0A2M4DMW8_ANODA
MFKATIPGVRLSALGFWVCPTPLRAAARSSITAPARGWLRVKIVAVIVAKRTVGRCRTSGRSRSLDRHRLLRYLYVRLYTESAIDFLHQKQHCILRVPIAHVAGQSKQVLVDELERCLLQYVIDATRLI